MAAPARRQEPHAKPPAVAWGQSPRGRPALYADYLASQPAAALGKRYPILLLTAIFRAAAVLATVAAVVAVWLSGLR